MKISLSHKERDLLASALYRLARKDPSPKTAYRVGPVAIPRGEILGEAREFTLLDADVETIKRALAEPGWFVGDDGKAVEDLRVISRLLEKFNVEG